MTQKNYTKSFKIGMSGVKSAFSGADVTPDMLSKINRFALKEVTADDVFVRKFLMAHNMVDRDGERFSEDLLDDFARTFPGKSFLHYHDRREYLPYGLFFDASTEEMTPEKYKELTGEEPRLPEDKESVKVLWAWFYLMADSTFNKDLMLNIEGGTYRHGSIGFDAADLIPIKGDFDQFQYWEYISPGEATEGSLVWLGAQQGATTQKKYKGNDKEKEKTGDINQMKKFIQIISGVLGKSFDEKVTEEELAGSVKSVLEDKDAEIKTLQDQLSENRPLIEEGKLYRKNLTSEYVRMKCALGECEQTPEAQDSLKKVTGDMPINFLDSEVKSLEVRMAEKFPADGKLNGDDHQDKTKDLNDEKENELIPKEDK